MSRERQHDGCCFHGPNRVKPLEILSNTVKIRHGRYLHIKHFKQPVAGYSSNVRCQKWAEISQHFQEPEQSKREGNENAPRTTIARGENQGNEPVATSTASRTDSELTKTMIEIEAAMSEVTNASHRQHLNGSQNSLQSVLDEDGGSVIFFIHGVGGSASLWYYQLQYFREVGFEVVAPDLLGHGFSPCPRNEAAYAFDELSKDCLALFDMYSKKRNILIGHSYGASFCTVIAKERCRKVTKMILISGGGPVSLEPQSCHIFCLPSFILAILKPVLTKAFLRQAFHQPLPKVPAEHFSAFNVPSFVLRGTMQGQNWPDGDEDYHATLNVAVLLLYGLKDEFVSLEETEWMKETIYASTLETIPDAGHMVMLEFPDQVNHLIHQFIMKDMVVKNKSSKQLSAPQTDPTHKFSVSPVTRKKTMPNLMPGALQSSLL